MYKEIGFEVHLEPFNAAGDKGCAACMALNPEPFKTIYTRRKQEGN